MAVFDLTH